MKLSGVFYAHLFRRLIWWAAVADFDSVGRELSFLGIENTLPPFPITCTERSLAAGSLESVTTGSGKLNVIRSGLIGAGHLQTQGSFAADSLKPVTRGSQT